MTYRCKGPSGSCVCFFVSSRRRHTRLQGDWSSDVCSSDLSHEQPAAPAARPDLRAERARAARRRAAPGGLRRHGPRRSHPRDRGVEGGEPQRHLRAPVGAGYRSAEHAQQGEPPGGDLHAAGRGARAGGRGRAGSRRRGAPRRRRRDTPAGGCAAMSSVVLPGAPPVNLNVVRWIGFQTIVIREYGRIIRIWGQTIVPSVVTATLYFVIFGSLIGRRVGVMGGFDYKQYIAPGLIMMSVITNSYGNVVASFFGAKFGKHVEELLVSPLPNWVIVAGYASGGMVRGLLVGTAVTVVSLLFTHLQVQHLPVILAAGLLTSLIFALGGFLNVLFAKNFDQVKWIPTFILTPLTYFGGVFYSITLLPPWAQQVSYINPILHMVNAFRFGFLGVSDVSIGLAFALMALAAAALFAVAVALRTRGPGIRQRG